MPTYSLQKIPYATQLEDVFYDNYLLLRMLILLLDTYVYCILCRHFT